MRESLGSVKPRGAVKAWGSFQTGAAGQHSRGASAPGRRRTRWDPKDGQLCPARTTSGETLMEVRSDSDVQIDRQS